MISTPTSSPTGSEKLILLGTGTPNGFPDRSGPAAAVIVDGIPYIVDAGPGVVRRASAAHHKLGIPELALPNLAHLFLTHLHSDHTIGLPDLMLTPWVLGRKHPLKVWGPEGTKRMTTQLLEAYREDIALRRTGPDGAETEGWKVNVSELAKPGSVLEHDSLRVDTFPVSHGPWPAFGFRFTTHERTIVLSGDTRPVDSLLSAAKGCDILVHEVYSERRFASIPQEWKDYHRRMHTSTKELARIAEVVRPGTLVLTHQLFWGATEDELLQEITELYDGEVVSGKDLDVF